MTSRSTGSAGTLQLVRRWSSRVEGLSKPIRYAVAVGAAAGGLLVRLTLEPMWGQQLPYITLFPAIMVSAWVGGLGPGLLTTFLAALGAAYFWVPPLRSLWITTPGEWLGLSVFVVVGLVISVLNEAWRRGTVALADSEQRLAVTLASIGDAVLTTDENGLLLTMNEAAERLTGWPTTEAIGRPVEDLFVLSPHDAASIVPNPVRKALREGKVTSADGHTLVTRHGGRIPIDMSAAAIRLADRTAGVVVTARDITERRQAEAERARVLDREQQARVEIERAAQLKDDFLAVLSHELRTPLNAVLGYTQLLLSGAVPPDRRAHALQAIQRNAQAQARLVESLLDLSRVLAGKLELNAEVIELSSVIALAIDAVMPEALKKNISLRIGETEHVRVFVDGPRLQQVLWNLLSNAIKFTPARGQVTVDLASTDTEAVIRVKDNGRGIAGSLLPFVFDRFRQGDGESSRLRTGLGLGLALAREMVHAHKGTVTAESPGDGLGSTFTVRLPLLLPREPALLAATQQNRQQRPDLHQSQPNVLIVDDERDARDMLGLMLEMRGARVQHAGTAADAFNSMVEERPDVLLADVGMPGEDGHSLMRRWRTHEGAVNPRVAAIAVTAYASPTDREMALAAGFDGHIAKPVDADELVRAIATLLARDQ